MTTCLKHGPGQPAAYKSHNGFFPYLLNMPFFETAVRAYSVVIDIPLKYPIVSVDFDEDQEYIRVGILIPSWHNHC
jgi:hypothetical protein